MKFNYWLVGSARAFLSFSVLAFAYSHALGAAYQWDFNGNLNATYGGGILSYADATTPVLTSFSTTNGTTVPHIGGQPATYMRVPVFTQLDQGYNAEFTQTGPNGGGSYVNQYTAIFDVLWPSPTSWGSFFNTDPENTAGNDGDFYLASDRSLGIGSLYTDAGVIEANTWYRIAFATDLSTGDFAYYVNGQPKFAGNLPSQLDQRFSLYSNLDAGADLRLFNEGDTSGDYTQELYLSSFYFADHKLNDGEIAALGSIDADGIAAQAGDFNGDGKVDAADYVIWRNTGGSAGDYAAWRANFGAGSGSGSSLGSGSNAAVPEPTVASLICLLAMSVSFASRRRAKIVFALPSEIDAAL